MKKLLKKLVNLGADKDMPYILQQRIRLANQIALFIYFLSCLDVLRQINAGAFSLTTSMLAVLTGLVLIINGLKFHRIGRFLLASAPSLILVGNSIQMKATGSVPLDITSYLDIRILMIPLTSMPWLFFLSNEKVYRLISIILVTVPLLFIDGFSELFGAGYQQRGIEAPLYGAVPIFTGFAIIFLQGVFYFMTRSTEEYRLRNEELLSDLKEKNKSISESDKKKTEMIGELEEAHKEILTQNEELRQIQEELETQRDYIEQKNTDLESKNQNINDSLRAAETIQQAILPPLEELDKYFSEHFLIFKPRDIVSGDFYWMSRKGEELWLVAADCTGHGVPGAFMTLLGKNLLDRIVNVWEVKTPAIALEFLDKEIQKSLRQETSGNTSGMDLMMLKINTENTDTYKIEFAGAKSYLYTYNCITSDFKEYKSDRVHIGGRLSQDVSFTNYELELNHYGLEVHRFSCD